MCDKNILENGGMLIFLPDCYEDHKVCDNDFNNYAHALTYFVLKCVIKLSILLLLQYNLFLINIRLKKYVTKLSRLFLLYLILFLINI